MEWIRSCYSSEWRLFRAHPEITTAGAYYFAPADVPFYDGFHNLGSRIWHDANHPKIVDLGEVLDVKPQWVDGRAPAVDVRPAAVGSPNCIAAGEDIDGAFETRLTIDGFVPSCILKTAEVDDVWQKATAFDNCQVQRLYAALIFALYWDDDDAIRDLVEKWLGASVVVTIHHHAGVRNGLIVLKMPSWTIAVFDGTWNAQELALQMMNFPQAPTNFGAYGTHPFWQDSATFALATLVADGLIASDRFAAVGHSYGGAVALNLIARFRAFDAARELRYLTFACPKIGDARMISLLDKAPGMNVINQDDIITILPPDRLTLLPFEAFAWFLPWQLYTEWERPRPQVMISPAGRAFFNPEVLTDYLTLLTLFERIAGGHLIDPSAPHRMPEYVARLQLRCPNIEWPNNPPAQRIAWIPNEAVALNGKNTPDGALIFNAVPIPVPGVDCDSALELVPGESFQWLSSATGSQWYKCGPIEPFAAFHIAVSGAAGGFIAVVKRGPNCSSLVSSGFFFAGQPVFINFFNNLPDETHFIEVTDSGERVYTVSWDYGHL